jgi:hypothetical protein
MEINISPFVLFLLSILAIAIVGTVAISWYALKRATSLYALKRRKEQSPAQEIEEEEVEEEEPLVPRVLKAKYRNGDECYFVFDTGDIVDDKDDDEYGESDYEKCNVSQFLYLQFKDGDMINVRGEPGYFQVYYKDNKK